MVISTASPSPKKPVADLWDVNRWIALRQRDRFQELHPDKTT
jgi:hypothetical protein